MIGTSPPLKGSELVLDLPMDPANNRTFEALSSDSQLGTLDSGLVTAQVWAYFGPSTSKRLIFQGTSPDGTVYRGNIHLAPVVSGSLIISKNGQTVRYRVSPASANVTISGETFNDLNGNGQLEGGEPGLPGWTVDLFDTATGALVAETTSGAGGQYSFTNTYPGSYTIAEKVQAGWIQTAPAAPGTYSVFAFDGGTLTGKNFGNFQPVSVSGNVYNDLNGDGQNEGEPGLQNWEVDVKDSGGNVVGSAFTDASGNYTISGVGPGTFTVSEVVQSGWIQTQPVNPNFYSFTSTSGGNVAGENFGNFQTVSVSGNVYNDLNGDGSRDPGEPGLQNWEVDVKDSGGNVVGSALTDANGNYTITGVGPGSFTLDEVVQSGWVQTQPVNPPYYSFTTSSGVNVVGGIFGNARSEGLSGLVYNDLNGDGSSDGGTDPVLVGWTINVLDSSGNLVATTTSGADGSYSFTGLPLQPYTIQEVVQSGWTITQPTNPPGTYTVPAGAGDHTGLDFGNFQLVSVSGNVYNDLNGNGSQDAGEPGLGGWTVDVVDSSGNVVASAVSDPSGNYTITGVGPGAFTLQEVVQPGWILTQPTNPSYYSFTTSSGVNVAGGIFGNFQTISVSGNVYNDQDGNGLRGVGEPGLQNWAVNLDDSAGNVLASVLSDSNGNYAFSGVGPGIYQVAQVVQANWVQTQPQYPTSYTFEAQGGHDLIDLNFGDHSSPAINPSQVIDNGQAGYSETGTWSTVVAGFNGTNRVARTVHSGSTTATATWDFTGVGSTLVDVWATFAGKSGYSTAAPFTVYDGGISLGTQSINESILVTQNQGGRAQGSYGGVGWLELGSFVISSGEVKVVLNNLASGNFVDADGVLLVIHGGGAPVRSSSAGSTTGTHGDTIAIGTVDRDSSTPSSRGNSGRSAAPTIALDDVPAPSRLTVIYDESTQPIGNPYSPSAIDTVLQRGISSKRGVRTYRPIAYGEIPYQGRRSGGLA